MKSRAALKRTLEAPGLQCKLRTRKQQACNSEEGSGCAHVMDQALESGYSVPRGVNSFGLDRVYVGDLYSPCRDNSRLSTTKPQPLLPVSLFASLPLLLHAMAAYSVEVQKQRYSQELAEHTLRQWEAARAAMERAAQDDTHATSTSPSHRASSAAVKTPSRSSKSRTRGKSSTSPSLLRRPTS